MEKYIFFYSSFEGFIELIVFKATPSIFLRIKTKLEREIMSFGEDEPEYDNLVYHICTIEEAIEFFNNNSNLKKIHNDIAKRCVGDRSHRIIKTEEELIEYYKMCGALTKVHYKYVLRIIEEVLGGDNNGGMISYFKDDMYSEFVTHDEEGFVIDDEEDFAN